MKIASALVCFLCACPSSAFALSEDMTLDFTWIGTSLCASQSSSPRFQVENMPSGTTQLRFVLTNTDGSELGGADVPAPLLGLIPRGAVSFRSPCVGGMYTWTVDAMDAKGRALASARLTRPFY